jgi:hypothetical protein
MIMRYTKPPLDRKPTYSAADFETCLRPAFSDAATPRKLSAAFQGMQQQDAAKHDDPAIRSVQFYD